MKNEKLRDDILNKVLKYWFVLELLAQDKYPAAGVDVWNIQNKVSNLKRDILKGKPGKKVINNFVTLKEDCDICEVLSSEAKECKMNSWGYLTLYIGKIKREACIESIAQKIQIKDSVERPEKNNDEIAWISLQLSPEGEYIEHSLSLSTIMWAMSQVKNTTDSITERLDEEQYREDVKRLERKFFAKKDIKQKGTVISGDEDKISKLAIGAVTWDTLIALFEEIKQKYVTGNIPVQTEDESIKKTFEISFQLFENESVREEKEEENYQGLSHDFYSDDVRLLMDKAKQGVLEADNNTGTDIIRYITALYDEGKEDRIDLVNPEEYGPDIFQEYLSVILDVRNASLGKWPSKFMPVLMQQVAINLENSDVNKSNIFSVNGPPGTGKTTLLKEVIVNNIVERAILLSKYDNPDEEAFDEHKFTQGNREGNAYSKYIRRWYTLENDRINDYGILVASCNNAAVENISKELPMGSNILRDLQADSNDSKEMQDTLAEVQQLFDVEQSMVSESNNKETYRDIYFTKYAKDLLEDKDVWGVIASPMGKRANIGNFYKKVLNPLLWDFYPRKEVAQNRVEKFQEVKKLFLEQLERVKKQREELVDICHIAREQIKVAREKCHILEGKPKEIREREDEIAKLEKDIRKLQEELNQVEDTLAQEKEKEQVTKENLNQSVEKINEKSAGIKEFMEKEYNTRKSMNFITRVINKDKYNAAKNLADSYKEEVKKAQSDLFQLKEKEEELKAIVKAGNLRMDELLFECEKIEVYIGDCEQGILECRKSIHASGQEMQDIKAKYAKVNNEYQKAISKLSKGNEINAGAIIDDKFVECLLSNDMEKSTKAQVTNPWFTQKYNREREKLFYYAMRLNKEFVLSSNHCRDNLRTLSQYWGLELGDEKEKIIFHKEDREAFVAALYQTLFLLVPVLSSTFASIGTFLKDIKNRGAIGMLIVDEAGQAQPQMALGALYRSRKAIIVGDPKQVEPVVTDDLKLLKEVFDDEILRPYKSKVLSVQGFADELNEFGTYLDNGTDIPDWIGCPLLVHRRCISPMYDISNELSYNNIMKQQTRKPSKEVSKLLVYSKSQWINVVGKEKGNKDHFVDEQGKKVCDILEKAFEKNDYPNLYIISPFTSVVSGIRAYIKKFCKMNPRTAISKGLKNWIGKNIGTVHTFQGKEANEVIFLLGCDASAGAKGAIRWVNNNIVNVAATRAKFRLYVIGDAKAWEDSICVSKAKAIIDTFAIRGIQAVLAEEMSTEEKKLALEFYSESLPPVTAFPMEKIVDEDGEIDYSIDVTSLLKGLGNEFIANELSREQLGKFGFENMKELNELPIEIRSNLILGIKLFYLLQPVYAVNKKLDASCCAIMFCKAIELQVKECFSGALKAVVPNHKMRGGGHLKDAQDKEITLGAFEHIIRNNISELGSFMKQQGREHYNADWWRGFGEKLKDCTKRRNKCCHAGMFSWEEQAYLLFDIFVNDSASKDVVREPSIGGLLFESVIGKELT